MFEHTRDNSNRARQALLVFVLIIIISAIAISAQLYILYQLAYHDKTALIGLDAFYRLTRWFAGFVHLPVVILAAVYFLRWCRRAYGNLRRANVQTEHSEGWVIGTWFVPMLNLVQPYSIMREIWQRTQRLSGVPIDSHKLLRWWWFAFLLRAFLAPVAFLKFSNIQTLPQLQKALWFDIWSAVADIVSALLTIYVIHFLASYEQILFLRASVNGIGGLAPEPQELLPTEPDAYF